jgi:putative endonuclease
VTDLGARGEALAAARLEQAGWRILARNWRFGHREIDLIVERDGIVAFVEVKTRAGPAFGHPAEAITARKRRDLARAAQAWVLRNGRPEWVYRFDAIAVWWPPQGPPRLEHIEDAWRLEPESR